MTWVAALSFVVLLLLEAVIPRTVDASTSEHKVRHSVRNAALWAMGVALIWGLSAGVQNQTGAGPALPSRGLGLWFPLSAQLVLAVVLVDLSEYLRHRAFHRVRTLWLVHAVHHSDDAVDVTTGLRFHPLEVAFILALRVMLLVAMGLPVWALAVRELFQIPVSALQHANIRLPAAFEPLAGWLIVTPAMHRVHHSRLKNETDSNYGELFSFWDRLFGTYNSPSRASGSAMGLNALTAESWQTVFGLLATPIRARNIKQF